MNYQELIEDHDHIDRLSAQLEELVRKDRIDQDRIDRLLAALATAVDEHLSKEDSFIYPQIAYSADPADATSLIVEFEEIKRDWHVYLASWANGRALQDWAGFKVSTLGMLERLRQRVMKETGLLYGMALRQGLITMRPDAG